MEDKKLSDLVDCTSMVAVIEEAQAIMSSISEDFDSAPVASAFQTIIELFEGNYPGYNKCNTEYHDLLHTTDTFLAMTRLTHGAVLNDEPFDKRSVTIGLMAALFHDTGYIQEKKDKGGTGAKHTVHHVIRSAEFFEKYMKEMGFAENDISLGKSAILCTDLSLDFSDVPFKNPEMRLLGQLLCAADLLAQMSDRTYLEKLLFLYHEFSEAGIGGYESELDLLQKTIGFYGFIDQRLHTISDRIDRFLVSHFSKRWEIKKNLYQDAIDKQKNYLSAIMEDLDSDPLGQLKRHGIAEKVREKYHTEP